ncbi:hypothetical protein K661_00199 [Piscirickettsia salmonis LF-89 = ATCC VR-1361]|nr:hypothetical protein K661_00199 [Piscirickettsia salmonis LF-89 = ATCC VR-1361]
MVHLLLLKNLVAKLMPMLQRIVYFFNTLDTLINALNL